MQFSEMDPFQKVNSQFSTNVSTPPPTNQAICEQKLNGMEQPYQQLVNSQNFGSIKMNQNFIMHPSIFLVMNNFQENLEMQEQQKLKGLGIPDPIFDCNQAETKQLLMEYYQKIQSLNQQPQKTAKKETRPTKTASKRKAKLIFKVEKVLRDSQLAF